MTRLGKEHLGDMSHEGESVKTRRERLGLDKKELAELAGVNRNTLAALEAGESFNRSTLTKVERALQELEDEAGYSARPVAGEAGQALAAQTRSQWPQDVQVFLDVMGVYLSSMDDARRRQVIADLIQQIVAT